MRLTLLHNIFNLLPIGVSYPPSLCHMSSLKEPAADWGRPLVECWLSRLANSGNLLLPIRQPSFYIWLPPQKSNCPTFLDNKHCDKLIYVCWLIASPMLVQIKFCIDKIYLMFIVSLTGYLQYGLINLFVYIFLELKKKLGLKN